jgi:hypothetical protein
MTRTRSSLETAIIAWVALKIISTLLGFGLTVETLSNRSTAGVNIDVGRAIGYVSIGLGILILFLLMAEGKYLIAACLAVAATAIPLAIQAHIPSISHSRLNPVASFQGVASALSNAQHSFALRPAAIPVVGLYDALAADSTVSRRATIRPQGNTACERMTAAAQAELEEAMLKRRTGGRRSCLQALGVAARRKVFGRPYSRTTVLLSRISVLPRTGTAVFFAGGGVQVELVAAKPGEWLISRFVGIAGH